MTMKLVPVFMQILALRTLKEKEKKKERKEKSLCYLTEFVITFSIFLIPLILIRWHLGAYFCTPEGKMGGKKKKKKKKNKKPNMELLLSYTYH